MTHYMYMTTRQGKAHHVRVIYVKIIDAHDAHIHVCGMKIRKSDARLTNDLPFPGPRLSKGMYYVIPGTTDVYKFT